MFVRTDLSIPLKSRFSQPLSQVIVLNVSLNFFVPSLRSSLSSSRTNTLLTFTLYLTDYLYSFRAFGHYHKCCFVFCLPTTVSNSQWPKISLFSASSGRSSILFPFWVYAALTWWYGLLLPIFFIGRSSVCQFRACWHYFSHMKTHAIWTNDRKITSSLSYLVHTLRYAFSHRNSLSIIFLRLYSSWSYSHGFMRFFFGGTTGLCPKDWQSSLVLSPS